ncbi:MAG: hypothetical protein M3O03_07915, partial [Pseudomonadota bacterium]|nr:hypothetical protein [Pseudomonadota bacterium]
PPNANGGRFEFAANSGLSWYFEKDEEVFHTLVTGRGRTFGGGEKSSGADPRQHTNCPWKQYQERTYTRYRISIIAAASL